MAKFLSRSEIFNVIQREMPDNVFPDGAPASFLSTADNDSVAGCVGTAYASLSSAHADLSLMTTSENIAKWEFSYLGLQYEGEELESRRARILAKIRQNEDISLWQIQLVVASFIPDTWIEIIQRNQLDDETSSMVKGALADTVWGRTWTSGDPFPSGVTGLEIIRTDVEQMRYAQRQAFIYDIFVFTNETISAETLQKLDEALLAQEPARCRHTISIVPPVNLDFWESVYDTNRYSNANQLKIGTDGTFRRETLWFGFDEDPNSRGFGDVEGTPDEGFLFTYPPSFGFDNDGVGLANGDLGMSDEAQILGGNFSSVGVVGGGFFFIPELM